MKRIYTLPFIALLFMPFCGHRKREAPIAISSAEVSLSVELDVLQFSIQRRLYELEHTTIQSATKTPPTQNMEAVSASEAVRQ